MKFKNLKNKILPISLGKNSISVRPHGVFDIDDNDIGLMTKYIKDNSVKMIEKNKKDEIKKEEVIETVETDKNMIQEVNITNIVPLEEQDETENQQIDDSNLLTNSTDMLELDNRIGETEENDGKKKRRRRRKRNKDNENNIL